MYKWEIGQKVRVYDRGRPTDDVYEVRRVLRRFVELTDGSKWDTAGYTYPKFRARQAFFRRLIRPVEE